MDDDDGPQAQQPGAAPGSGGADGKKTRSQKTPLQKEVLEASFKLNPNPNEEHRRALGERIGLDEKQVSAWFINRRRKDKRAEDNKAIALAVQQNLAAAQPSTSSAAHAGGTSSQIGTPQPQGPTISGTASQQAASGPVAHPHHVSVMTRPAAAGPSTSIPSAAAAITPAALASPRAAPAMSVPAAATAAAAAAVSPPASAAPSEAELSEYLQLLEAAKETLDAPYTPTGPPLAAVFDESPEAEGVGVKRKRVALNNFVADADAMAQGSEAPAQVGVTVHPSTLKTFQRPKPGDRQERERQRFEEERLRELERAERERRKVADRMDKERLKEEARRLREMEKLRQQQEREARKLEAIKDRERKAEEKKKAKEEQKRAKELGRAQERQERALTRQRQHNVVGPPDDEDLEMEALQEEQRIAAGYPPHPPPEEGTPARQLDGSSKDTPMRDASCTPPAGGRPPLPTPPRPEFPPPSLGLVPAFPPELEADGIGPDVLMVTAFLHTFSDQLGLRPTPSVDQLAQALFEGSDSLVLAAVHTSLLRLLQADMEEAHATGATANTPGSLLDKATVIAAHQLEAAWAWGYDIDVWRAHLNALTWPEVFREVAVTISLPPRRKRGRRPGRGSTAHNRPKIGDAGEDLYEDQGGGLKLRLPARYSVGSVKAAAWQVLAECGVDGLTINEIARRIQEGGLRDLRSSRTPEASVAGALSRDVLFTRVAPATFALTSILHHQRRLLGFGKDKGEGGGGEGKGGTPGVKTEGGGSPGEGKAAGAAAAGSSPAVKQEQAEGAVPMEVDGTGTPGVKAEAGAGGEVKQEGQEEDEEGYSGDEDLDEEGNFVEQQAVAYSKESWANQLAALDYDSLTVKERLDALLWLVHAALEGPTMRLTMEVRVEDAANIKKQLLEDAKNEKRKRQVEAAAKARAAAEEATKKLEELQAAGGQLPGQAGGAGGGGMSEDMLASDVGLAAKMAMEAAAVAAQRAAAVGQEDVEEEKVGRTRRLDMIRKVDEEKAIRWEPLGSDRRHNRYWRVCPVVTQQGLSATPDSAPEAGAPGANGHAPAAPGAGEDPGVGRVLVESHDGSSWRLLSQEHQLDSLMSSLEPKGVREGVLSANLCLFSSSIKAGMPSQPLKLDPPSSNTDKWSKVFHMIRPCAASFPCAYPVTTPTPPPTDTPKITKVKHDMCRIMSTLPAAALVGTFDRQLWTQHVCEAANPTALRRCLGQLETSILPAYLTAAFQRNPDILKAAWSSPHRQQQEAEAAAAQGGETQTSTIAEPLSWLPPTYAAIALRTASLDAALYYQQSAKCGRDKLLGYKYILKPGPLFRPSDGVEAAAAACIPQAPHLSTEYGGVTVACSSAITTSGRPRHVLLFPHLLYQRIAAAPEEFSLEGMSGMRATVEEAQAMGTLYPPPPQPPSATGGQPPPGSRQPGSRAAAARADAVSAARHRRIELMIKVSGAVRSAFARATQNRGGRDKDKLSKARSSKARKVRQSNLSKEWERQRSDDEGDYGDGYDDGFDDALETGDPGLYGAVGKSSRAQASEDAADFDYDPAAENAASDDGQEEDEEEQ